MCLFDDDDDDDDGYRDGSVSTVHMLVHVNVHSTESAICLQNVEYV